MVELFEVYPKTVTEQALGYASNDSYQTISVELDYHHWVYANERSPTSSQVDDFSGGGEFGGTPTGNTTGGETDPGTVSSGGSGDGDGGYQPGKVRMGMIRN